MIREFMVIQKARLPASEGEGLDPHLMLMGKSFNRSEASKLKRRIQREDSIGTHISSTERGEIIQIPKTRPGRRPAQESPGAKPYRWLVRTT